MKMKTFYGGLILKNAEIQDFLVLDEFIGEQLEILNILKLSLIFTNQNAFSYQKDGDFLF